MKNILFLIVVSFTLLNHLSIAQPDPYLKYKTLIQNKKYKEALIGLNESIKKDTSNAGLYYLRSKAHEKLKKFDKAISDFEHYIKNTKEKSNDYLELARLRQKRIDSFYLNDEPHDANGARWWGGEGTYDSKKWGQEKWESYKRIINDTDRAIELDSANNHAYCYKAYCLFSRYIDELPDINKGLLFLSIENISKAISIKPDTGYYFYFRAEIELRLHDTLNACRDLKIAAKFNEINSKEMLKNLCDEIKDPKIKRECCGIKEDEELIPEK